MRNCSPDVMGAMLCTASSRLGRIEGSQRSFIEGSQLQLLGPAFTATMTAGTLPGTDSWAGQRHFHPPPRFARADARAEA